MEVLCLCCGERFARGLRHKEQAYCGKEGCQRKRKARWQKQKIMKDADYRENQKRSQEEWVKKNPGYWKEYRRRKPEKAERNRVMQVLRNRRRRKESGVIAKMDALKLLKIQPFGEYFLVPLIAKMDALKVNIYAISDS